MREYTAPDPKSPTLVLAHGAGAGEQHPWMVRVGKGLAARGVHVVTFNFPYMDAGKSVPDRADVLEKAYADAWTTLTAGRSGPLFAGGKSMGGRIASQVAAQEGVRAAAGRSRLLRVSAASAGQAAAASRQASARHHAADVVFPRRARPLRFARRDDRTRRTVCSGSTLHIVEGGDHSLVTRKKAGPGGDALDKVMDQAAEWMRRVLY